MPPEPRATLKFEKKRRRGSRCVIATTSMLLDPLFFPSKFCHIKRQRLMNAWRRSFVPLISCSLLARSHWEPPSFKDPSFEDSSFFGASRARHLLQQTNATFTSSTTPSLQQRRASSTPTATQVLGRSRPFATKHLFRSQSVEPIPCRRDSSRPTSWCEAF